MSIHIISMAWKLPKIEGLSVSDKAVLLKLADHADDEGGSCFPSITRIANECWCTEKTVSRSVARLEKLGLISKRLRKNTTNIYTINVRKIETINAQNRLSKVGDTESFTEGTQSPVVGDTESGGWGTQSPPNRQCNRQFNRQSSCSKPKGQQQPISEEDFDKLRKELRAELKATLKDGSKLYEKFIHMNPPARRGEASARRFFEYEKAEVETERERQNRIAEEDAAFIDTVRRATGNKYIPNRKEAERLMRESNSTQPDAQAMPKQCLSNAQSKPEDDPVNDGFFDANGKPIF